MAERTRSQVQRDQRQATAQMSECFDSKAALEEKIERLNEAKSKVAPIDEDVDRIRSSVLYPYYSDVARWHGQQRTDHEDFVTTDTQDELRTYIQGASDLYTHICDQITALENQRHDDEGVIGWLTQRINDLQNELDTLVN